MVCFSLDINANFTLIRLFQFDINKINRKLTCHIIHETSKIFFHINITVAKAMTKTFENRECIYLIAGYNGSPNFE